ncbi:MAG TPA: IclR family transcriptional regulator [Acidimicrobiia bacterium]|nr:IclR family transcriptional regulator [Acidimicrobiia bacterium]
MIQSVDRAIRILGVLQGSRRLGLSDIAARLDLPVSTVHGIVKTLVSHGMVEQDRGSGRYQLGPATLLLGNVYLDTLEMRGRAFKWTEELARRTGLAVRVGVLLMDDVVIVQHEPRPDGTRQMPEVGIVIPAHACALGKALLAYRPEDRARVTSYSSLRAMTGETLTEPDLLEKELNATSVTAIATENDEAVLGDSGIAAPVFDGDHPAIGAIGVVIASGEYPSTEGVVEAVREAARNLSRELGSSRWPVAQA